MQAAIQRPPYVTFEVRAEEDRAASIAAGHYVAQDVHYALVTPQGSKDRVERKVKEWFEHLEQQVREERFDAVWLDRYKREYDAWKSGREVPTNGFPVAQWPAISPAQLEQLRHLRVLTVEDLAAANEETISRLGMGGRALKQRAAEWLSAAAGTGKVAEELSALKVANQDLAERNASLQEQLTAISKQLEALSPKPATK